MRKVIYERFDTSLGMGLGKVKGKMFRIGHLGECNEVSLMGTLAAVEMGLSIAGVLAKGSGVVAAMDVLKNLSDVVVKPALKAVA